VQVKLHGFFYGTNQRFGLAFILKIGYT